MRFEPDRHHRRSIRLSGYDYTRAGAYFVTICTHQRQGVLGHIDGTAHTLSRIGRIIAEYWLALPRHFLNIELDAWVVMPDHVHGIILIHTDAAPAADNTRNPKPVQRDSIESKPNGTRPDSLPAIVQNFKSVSTRKANRLNRTPGAPLWQRNYYERIIRNECQLDALRRYIDTNPARWNNAPLTTVTTQRQNSHTWSLYVYTSPLRTTKTS